MSFLTLHLSITDHHVSEMVDRFESGLCDPGTSNAVCLALRQQAGLPPGFRVSFHRGRLRASLGAEFIELPKELTEWLRRAMEGWAVAPRIFTLKLPAHWVESTPALMPLPKREPALVAA